MYSQLIINTDEEHEHYVLVEPYYLKSNPLIFSKEDMIIAAENRKNFVRSLLNKQKVEREVSLVVVVENTISLRKAVEYYKREFSDYG